MVRSKVHRRTDNVVGLPFGGTADNTYRPDVVFTDNVNGGNYASTDNAAPFNGICEACHTVANHYRNTGRNDSSHSTNKCTTCHPHDSGFAGLGGPDVGQYFDNIAGAGNYADNSRHPLVGFTTAGSLLFGGSGSTNCLGCHYASGAATTSDECLKCHYENNGASAALGAQHMDGQIQLASNGSGNSFGTSQYAISTIANYDDWCLNCHGRTTVTLGGVQPDNTRGTLLDPAAFSNGRHRAQAGNRQVGCIFCHQPHGRSNAKLVRENAANRGSAWYVSGAGPRKFGVYPVDNTGSASYVGYFNANPNENVLFRSRNRWENAAMPYVPDAGDDNFYCNKACHNPAYPKDRQVVRDNNTGNYILTAGNLKQYTVDGFIYTKLDSDPYWHVHVNGEIVTTDNMVQYYAGLNNISGPSYYQYPPATGSSAPSAYVPANSPLPFTPDYGDSDRDFTNGYQGQGRIRFRFTCSTCHDPHGTTLPNQSSQDGYPDLRLRKNNPNALCAACHE
jgi:hypothetical protein